MTVLTGGHLRLTRFLKSICNHTSFFLYVVHFITFTPRPPLSTTTTRRAVAVENTILYTELTRSSLQIPLLNFCYCDYDFRIRKHAKRRNVLAKQDWNDTLNDMTVFFLFNIINIYGEEVFCHNIHSYSYSDLSDSFSLSVFANVALIYSRSSLGRARQLIDMYVNQYKQRTTSACTWRSSASTWFHMCSHWAQRNKALTLTVFFAWEIPTRIM